MEKIRIQTTGVVNKGGGDAPFDVFARFVTKVAIFSYVCIEFSGHKKMPLRMRGHLTVCPPAGWLTYRLNADEERDGKGGER